MLRLIKLMLSSDFKRGMIACLRFLLTQAEGGVAEGDWRTLRPARCLGRDVVMGAPPEPAAVAVPVTNPTRDSGWSQRFGEGQGVRVRTSWNSQSQRTMWRLKGITHYKQAQNHRESLLWSGANHSWRIIAQWIRCTSSTCLRRSGTQVLENFSVFVSNVSAINCL